ncbi:MAG: hypothetical protein Kow0090_19930 [Myxococcota bacterium]
MKKQIAATLGGATAFLALSILSSCGAKVKPVYISESHKHPRYTPALFITAVGVSQKDAEDAEQNAKARIAEQIRSSIESESESSVKEISAEKGESQVASEFSSRVRQTAQFSHAELIKIDKGSAFADNGIFYAFAYLNRREAVEILSTEYKNAAEPFRAAARAIIEPNTPFGQFIIAYKKMHESFTTLVAKASEIRAIMKSSLEDYADDASLFQKAEKSAEERIANLHINVIVASPNKADGELIRETLARTIIKLGIAASPSDTCGRSLALKLGAEENCKRGALGEVCALVLKGALIDCSNKKAIIDIEIGGFKGVHAKEQEVAREKMYEQLTEKKVFPLLKYKLGEVLPVK